MTLDERLKRLAATVDQLEQKVSACRDSETRYKGGVTMRTETEILLAELTQFGIRCSRCRTEVVADLRQPNITSPAYCPTCHLDLDQALRERLHKFAQLLAVLSEEKEFVFSFHMERPQ